MKKTSSTVFSLPLDTEDTNIYYLSKYIQVYPQGSALFSGIKPQ